MLSHTALESFEHRTSTRCPAKFIGFHADGKGGFGLCLLCADSDAVTSFWRSLYMLPFQIENVADT